MLEKKHVAVAALLLSVFIVFKSLAFGSGVWGDAPLFFGEGLKELVSEPQVWTSRGTLLGGLNNLLWLSLLMFKYGALHQFLGLENSEIIRILFYFPAIIFALIGSWIFASHLKLSTTGRSFASLIYVANTYFILLIDGGQVGIALAYGLFPLALWSLRKFTEKPNINNFYLTFIFIFILGIADPRFSLISFIIATIWYGLELVFRIKKFDPSLMGRFLLLCLSYFLINFYWIYPLIKLGGSPGGGVSDLNLVSILNGLFLYQPHWPNNEFGKVVAPAFYFVGIPLLIFSNLLFKNSKDKLVLLLLFLICVFLAKGATPPLGDIYKLFLDNISFAQAFRDSTKFFVPLILFAGVLIGNTVDQFLKLKVNSVLTRGFTFFVWIYITFLVYPAILGNLNGVFAQRAISSDHVEIKDVIKSREFSRSAWFPEKHPFAFHNNNHPAIDAKNLVDLRPLATLNTGTFDRFNFFHKEETYDWLRIFGIKHLVFSGEFRKQLNEEEMKEWEKLLELIDDKESFKKVNDFPIYEVSDTLPHFYTLDKMIAVVGGEEIYTKLKKEDKSFDIANSGFVFLEDGKTDLKNFQGVASGSAVILFNDKHEEDLALGFLQKYFSGSDNAQGDWAIRGASEYLKWKYELLTHGIETKEFDYNLGVSFSSQPEEEISFNIYIPDDGKYVLAVRSFAKDEGEQLNISLNGGNIEVYPSTQRFSWYIKEGVHLKKGKQVVKIKNPRGFKVVNVVALIPDEEWVKAWEISGQFTQHFETISVFENNWSQNPTGMFSSSRERIEPENIGTLRMKVILPKEKWLVMTDNYHKEWKLNTGFGISNSIPVYSAVNGFYTDKGDSFILFFKGQEYFRWGIWITIISALTLAAYYFWSKSNEKSN